MGLNFDQELGCMSIGSYHNYRVYKQMRDACVYKNEGKRRQGDKRCAFDGAVN